MTVEETLKDVLQQVEEEGKGISPEVRETPVEDFLLAYYLHISEGKTSSLEIGLEFFLLGISMGIDFMRELKNNRKEVEE